jgi:hypothetical protein
VLPTVIVLALSYFFTEYKNGSPWSLCNTPLSWGKGEKSEVQVKTFLSDFATYIISLKTLTFNAIGSLTRNNPSNQLLIGPLCTYRGFNLTHAPHFLGPFKSNKERYLSHCDVLLDAIGRDGCFEDDAEVACLVLLWVKELVMGCEEFARVDNEFYIKHADDKGDQFLTVDDRIQAVIDWEWSVLLVLTSFLSTANCECDRAYTTTKAEAFAAPSVCWESEGYAAGDNNLSLEEKLLIAEYEKRGHHDLVECVRNGRKYHRLFDVLGEKVDLVSINAMTDAFLGGGQEGLPKSIEEWRIWALGKYEGEPVLEDVRRRVIERETEALAVIDREGQSNGKLIEP